MRLVGPVAQASDRGAVDAGWVRKNVVVDQRKLDAVRQALGVETETETIDVALVTFRRERVRGIATVRRAGGVEDVFESVQVTSQSKNSRGRRTTWVPSRP